MTGQNDDVPDCRRRKCGLTCSFEYNNICTCPVCNKRAYRVDMYFTHDCHGIPFRLVCDECYKKLMSKGYDGKYYTDADEQIEDNY